MSFTTRDTWSLSISLDNIINTGQWIIVRLAKEHCIFVHFMLYFFISKSILKHCMYIPSFHAWFNDFPVKFKALYIYLFHALFNDFSVNSRFHEILYTENLPKNIGKNQLYYSVVLTSSVYSGSRRVEPLYISSTRLSASKYIFTRLASTSWTRATHLKKWQFHILVTWVPELSTDNVIIKLFSSATTLQKVMWFCNKK